MRELTITEIDQVGGGIEIGLDYEQGSSLQLGLAGAALAVGSPIVAGFAFGAAIMLSVLDYASDRAAESNASGSAKLGGGSWNATGGSKIPKSESS